MSEVVGKDIKKVDDSVLLKYFEDLSTLDSTEYLNDFPKILRKSSVYCSLAYYLAKNIYKMNQYEGLEYIKLKSGTSINYFFFDPEIEEFIGIIDIQKTLLLPYNSYSVNLSQLEKEYIGRGYGSRMYLCILDNVDYLRSDSGLYMDSLNIWVNYLPKKVNVWAVLDNDKIKRMDTKKFISPDNVKYFVGSKKRSELKSVK